MYVLTNCKQLEILKRRRIVDRKRRQMEREGGKGGERELGRDRGVKERGRRRKMGEV